MGAFGGHGRLGWLILAPLFGSASAWAAPASVWDRAREPDLEARAAIMTQADMLSAKASEIAALLGALESMGGGREREGDTLREMRAQILRQIRRILEGAGADRVRADAGLRYRYAESLYDAALRGGAIKEDLARLESARGPLESLRESAPSPSIRCQVTQFLALVYARLGRIDDEIAAYSAALTEEAIPVQRSTLLANRAEAQMFTGDLRGAVAGYRASVAALSPFDMLRYGVTSLWGLAVALSRLGDFDQAMSHIQMARGLDPNDQRLFDKNQWFFMPPHDEAWYRALGHWARARGEKSRGAQDAAYGKAIEAWGAYLRATPRTDRYLGLAKAHLLACERERSMVRQGGKH